MIRRVARFVPVLAIGLALVGCSAAPAPITSPTGSATSGVDSATTLEEAWAKVGCDLDDPATKTVVDDTPAPLTERSGRCSPFEPTRLVFFFQLPTQEAALTWVEDSRIGLGPDGTFFRYGSVVIGTTVAETAALLAEVYEPL